MRDIQRWLVILCSVSVSVKWGWFSMSPSRQRPQTGPFAIPKIYPLLDISITKNLWDFKINPTRSLYSLHVIRV